MIWSLVFWLLAVVAGGCSVWWSQGEPMEYAMPLRLSLAMVVGIFAAGRFQARADKRRAWVETLLAWLLLTGSACFCLLAFGHDGQSSVVLTMLGFLLLAIVMILPVTIGFVLGFLIFHLLSSWIKR